MINPPDQAKQILIVDDEPTLIFFLKQGLQESDLVCRVDNASSSQEALSKLTLDRYDLLITDLRLPGNLNVSFANVDGEALLISAPGVAASSGSACTSAKPEPSHVLRALGIGDDLTRGSVRFGLGRFNTSDEVEFAIQVIGDAVTRLRRMGSLATPKPKP